MGVIVWGGPQPYITAVAGPYGVARACDRYGACRVAGTSTCCDRRSTLQRSPGSQRTRKLSGSTLPDHRDSLLRLVAFSFILSLQRFLGTSVIRLIVPHSSEASLFISALYVL